MSKDPAFLFYPNDYIGGTMGMTFEEKGAYIELLMTQFNRGHMTNQVIGQVVGHLWENLKDKFKVDASGLYYNERLELEIEKRKTFVQSRFNNMSGKNQYTKTVGHKEGHMTNHMENEDVNENIIIIDKEIENLFNNVVIYFDENCRPKTETQKREWCDTLDKLIRIDGHSPEHIQNIIKRTRMDDFWRTNFLSILKLRKKNKEQVMYFTVFENKALQKSKPKNRFGAGLDQATLSEMEYNRKPNDI